MVKTNPGSRLLGCGGVTVSTVQRVCIAVVLAVCLMVAAAQESEPEAAGESPPLEPAPAAEAAQASSDDAVAAQPEAGSTPLDELFIPSQEIAADEEVIFPVNI